MKPIFLTTHQGPFLLFPFALPFWITAAVSAARICAVAISIRHIFYPEKHWLNLLLSDVTAC